MIEKQPVIKPGWQRAVLFALALNVLVLLLFTGMGAVMQGSINIYISILLPAIISITTVYLFRTKIDKRSLTSLGLQWKSNESHAGTGFFLSILVISIGTLLLIANGNLDWAGVSLRVSPLLSGLILMMLTAVSEELVFRGYILNNLMQSMNKWWALLLSAIIFTIFHVNNPGVSILPVLNVFLGGMLLGINYIYTGNLWFSILFHAGWNFYQGPVLGYHVSGVNLESLLHPALSGNKILTGAEFGFEGSVLDAMLTLLACGLLVWIYEKRFSGGAPKNAANPQM
ncbi:MAG TPA: type II CAAX endopeptidase family protein [Chitinophagaceae bacterium]|jgi:membrane protease YdiL (CAAX protease family)|nr:type II CAAX endopeptidase family protein [Chitinophagaceae bacterium]